MTDQALSILLVDDDEDTCQNMADIFRDLGYRVDFAHDGAAALELVRGRTYDVALLDLKMPGMDGLALYHEIKKTQAAMVTFLITAYANEFTARAAASAGMWQIMSKPIDLPRLLPLIDDAMERPLILVVDDDDNLCASLWDLLREQGYRVCMANDGQRAIDQIRSTTRVVLIDLNRPDRDGADSVDIARQVRELNPGVQIVLITANPEELEPKYELLRDQSFNAICYKPFDVPWLLKIVERLARSGAILDHPNRAGEGMEGDVG